jgi:acetyltransferase
VRAVDTGDAELLRAFDDALSERSRQLRYHGWVPPMTRARAEALTRPDPSVHCALVATPSAGAPRIVADCRLTAIPHLPGSAEVSIAVADDFQGFGLGRNLIERMLAVAADLGVEAVMADVRQDNARMVLLLTDLGFARTATSLGVLTMVRRVAPQNRSGAGSDRVGGDETARSSYSTDRS